MAPFHGLFEPIQLTGESVLDTSLLFAMVVYGFIAVFLKEAIDWLSRRIVRRRAEQAAQEPLTTPRRRPRERRRVRLGDLALAFPESAASTAELHVGGAAFYPPMLRDIEGATSSVHINQFGFRPGEIGERFADALLARAADGVEVRVVVDARGSDPDGKSRDFYARLLAGGVEVRVVRAMQLRASPQPAAAGDAARAGRWSSSATSTTAST